MQASGEDLDGYVTEVDYPTRLIPQLTPGWITAIAAWHGVRPPNLSRPFRMLDIGCGTGIALAMAAASHPQAYFQGIDGMASHIAAGQTFGGALDNLDLIHATFDQMLEGPEADCDIVTAHGVLTWAGPDARDDAMALAARRLAPGGLLLVSYNALPGAARQLAFQHLVRTFTADGQGAPGTRYRDAFQKIAELSDAGFDAVPRSVVARLANLAREAPDDYFVHEYMHDGWAPLWPVWVKGRFAGQGLTYLGQADFLRSRLDWCVTPRQRPSIEAAPVDQRDMLIDMANDTPFRIDVYARDPVWDEDAALDVWLGAEAEADGPLETPVPAGEATFDHEAAIAVLAELADGPLPLRRLLEKVRGDSRQIRDAIDGLLVGDRLAPLSPRQDGSAVANVLNNGLAGSAERGEVLPIAAVAGACGPVLAHPVEIATRSMTVDRLIAQAGADTAFRSRFLDPGLDPTEPAHRARIAEGLNRVHDRFLRLGAAPWNSAG